MRHSARHQGGQSLFAAGDHDDTDTFHKKVKMKNTFMNQSHKHSFPLIALCMMAVVSIALAVPPPMGVAPVNPPSGGFAIDGEMLANSPAANSGDWMANTNLAPGSGSGVFTANGVALEPGRTFRFLDPFNNTSTDRIFAGGAKWVDNPGTWGWTTSKPSSKTDINNALLHLSTDANGHVWAVLAADRLSTAGDSYIDFELLQNLLTRNANGTFTTTGPNGGRTTNDILLSLAFTGGGKVADFFAWRWTPNGSGGFAYTDITAMLPAGGVFVSMNSNTVAAPFGAFGQTNYLPNAFAEAAIDLTALLGNFNACESFGFKTIMIKTKASASSSASIEDFIDPIQYNLNIGPGANAGADQVRCSEGSATTFALTGSGASGVQPVASTTWSVVSGSAVIGSPGSLATTASVSSASATLRLTVVLVNGCTKSDDVVLNVQQPQACSITGALSICPRTTNTYAAPSGMNEYLWIVSGNGSISGPANLATVKIVAGSVCDQGYTVTLTTRSNVCSVSCATEVVVNDTAAPVLTVPADRILDCPNIITSTNVTGVATATDSCSPATVSYTDAVTNGCGYAKTIARTWVATDECGNSVSRVQKITVRDISAPTLNVPANVTLECGAATVPAATGTATATDGCGSAVVTFNDVVTPACGSTRVITRTWTATDLCNNVTSATQTITVRDITAPALTIPANVIAECGGSTAPVATGTATATDACNTPAVTYTDATTNLCGGTKIITRLWTATDVCGNSTNSAQIITVRDTTAPTFTVPASVTQQAPGDTRTSVTGTATATDGCGSVVVSYSETVSNSCGLSKTVSRLWTAVDQCGNSTNKLQTITVVDTQKPVVAIPNVTIQCVGDVPTAHATLAAFRAAGGTATDNSGNTNLTFALMSNSGIVGSCPGIVTRVYRVTDDCGNFAEATQRVTVDDTLAPVVTCPPSLTVACGASLNPAITGFATATDNCATNLSTTYTDASLPSSYDINWYASDPEPNSAPYLPTFVKFGPGGIVCPTNGRAADPLRNAVAYGPTAGQLDALTSLGGEPFALGQIVPFQAVIDVSGGRGPENGVIEFTTSWSTHTTSNDEFGYDKNHKVLGAFVDSGDIGLVDPHFNAKVDSFSAVMVNAGTIDEKIQGTFRVSGLDTGDRVVVEIWVALMSSQPDHVGGTIAADLVGAQKVLTPPQPISTGSKTISIGNLNKMNQLPPPQSQPPLPPQPQPPTVLPGIITSVIDRTWRASDNCGNQGSCVQRFTVVDATAPSLTVPANVVLECPSATGTNVCGVAAALDLCGAATLTYSDSVSNTCGIAKVISRRWMATDSFGNSTNATQIITVVDTTPPTLTPCTNKTIAAGQPVVFDAPTATDAGGTPVVYVVGATTNSFADGSYSVTSTWCASDPCGNHCASQSQTITVAAPIVIVPTLTGLTISGTPTGILLRWPANAANYRLESSPTMSAPRWSPVPVTPTLVGNEYQVALPATGPSQFFRLSDGAPTLQLSVVAGQLRLSWPTAPSGYVLESSDTMLPGNWTPVPTTPEVINAFNTVDVPMTSPGKLFRLKK